MINDKYEIQYFKKIVEDVVQFSENFLTFVLHHISHRKHHQIKY
jgi:hypothetical protein